MIVVRFFNKEYKNNSILNRTISKVLDHLTTSREPEVRTLRDSSSVEMISGNLDSINIDNQVVVEMTVKKIIKIDPESISSKSDLDKFVKEIRHFCNQASEIEDLKYLPINYR